VPVVIADRLTKVYRVAEKAPGFSGTLRHFFARRYKEIVAVKEVSFELEAGEIVGFLGPNGAGKTTTLKMLTGLLYPTAGRAEVLGYRPQDRRPAFLKQITLVMGNKAQLLWDLPVLDTLRINAAIYEIPEAEYRERVRRFAALLELEDVLTQPVRKLSLGQRMKAELMAALLHHPKVLFLDEPTLGLDVNAQSAVRDFVRTYARENGATVLLTSHYMADIEALAERVVVIHEGRLLFDGGLRALLARFAPYKEVRLELSSPADRARLAVYGEVVEARGPVARLLVEKTRLTAAVARILAELPVRDLAVEEPPLEDVIGRVFREGRVA